MRSNEATTEMSESAYHDLADAWIGSLEESLEALDDVLDDFDISNAVRLHFAGQTTLLQFFCHSKVCSTSSLASTALMFSTNKPQTVKFGGLHQSGMFRAMLPIFSTHPRLCRIAAAQSDLHGTPPQKSGAAPEMEQSSSLCCLRNYKSCCRAFP